MRASFAARIRLIAALVAVAALILIVRLYGLQIVSGDTFRARAAGQYATNSTNVERGRIYFTPRTGPRVAAATMAYGYTLAISPKDIVDPHATYAALNKIYPIDEIDFLAKAGKHDDPYEEIATRVSSETGDTISAAGITGVHLYQESWRVYPAGEAAAQTIGFLGYGSGDTLTGQYGLERLYNDVLVKPGNLYTNFFADLFTNVASFAKGGDRPGADVVTAIEPSVQSFLEDLLTNYDGVWHPTEAGAIVMDPSTGAIIALAATPSFNPNDIKNADPNALGNPLVSHVYEFGSIMKALTMGAAIDAGVVTPESTYNDTGKVTYNGKTIGNYDGKARGPGTSMQQVLSQSLNVGAAYVAVDKLGRTKFLDYFKAYGLDEPTGIDLPNEGSPLTKNLDEPQDIEIATAAFGQGFAVTPVAMARALAVLANHGMLPSPHVTTALEYQGIPTARTYAPQTRAISAEADETLTRMLVTVVDVALRSGSAKIPELSVAAKTGTAQIVDPTTKAYYTDRYLHSFFGYFPAYNPKFLVFLYAVAPQGAQYASETWTAPFMETTKFLMNYYQIPPDRPTSE